MIDGVGFKHTFFKFVSICCQMFLFIFFSMILWTVYSSLWFHFIFSIALQTFTSLKRKKKNYTSGCFRFLQYAFLTYHNLFASNRIVLYIIQKLHSRVFQIPSPFFMLWWSYIFSFCLYYKFQNCCCICIKYSRLFKKI